MKPSETMKLYYKGILLVAALVLISCGNGSEKKKILTDSKGLPSELLLVVDKDIWQSDLKDTIKAITEEPVPGTMEGEPMFRTTQIFTDGYDRMFVTMHSKLFVHVDKSLKKPMIGINHNVSARPQIEVTVSAPSLAELRDFLPRKRQQIQDSICEAQLEMREMELRKHYSARVNKDLQKVLGMQICVPEEIKATKKCKDFLWAGTNQNEKDINLVVYTYPLNRKTAYDEAAAIDVRDSVMQKNIPGDQPDQWMETTREKGKPIVLSRMINVKGQPMLEIRGLWQMRNGALGGPFVTLIREDKAHNRAIATEGFVYNPNADKRDLLRKMEAAVRTLEIKK